jgi:Tol biopolymer transport system component
VTETENVYPGNYPEWSLDGMRVFYRHREHRDSREWKIIERDLASGAERIIANGEFGVFSLSPDGGSIAVALGLTGGGENKVVLISVTTGEIRELTRTDPAERFAAYIAPQWTADGRAVVVRKRTPNELWLIPTTGETPRKISLDVREWSFGPISQFSIHPDGRRLAFLSGSVTNEVMVLENFLARPSVKR